MKNPITGVFKDLINKITLQARDFSEKERICLTSS